jgi:hypothetical protein
MVISNEERAVLLKRLEKAREAKVKKQLEAKEAKEVKVATPVAIPIVVPLPVEEEVVEEEVVLPPKIKKAKKVEVAEEAEEEEVKPKDKKDKKEKKIPYMKLKLYREPSNPIAFQSLLENLNAEYEDEVVQNPPSAPIPIKTPRVLVQQGAKNEIQNRTVNEARALAMSFFS